MNLEQSEAVPRAGTVEKTSDVAALISATLFEGPR